MDLPPIISKLSCPTVIVPVQENKLLSERVICGMGK